MFHPKFVLAALAAVSCAGVVSCSSDVEYSSTDVRWRFVDRMGDGTVLIGAEGAATEREEAWLGRELSARAMPAAEINCPPQSGALSLEEVDAVMEGLHEPGWVEASEVLSVASRFRRVEHQCAAEFPQGEYWFDDFRAALNFAENSQIEKLEEGQWIAIFHRSELERFARTDDAGTGMGWSIATNPAAFSGAIASYFLADCDRQTLVDAVEVRLSREGFERPGGRYPLQLRDPLTDQGDLELIGWLCQPANSDRGRTFEELLTRTR